MPSPEPTGSILVPRASRWRRRCCGALAAAMLAGCMDRGHEIPGSVPGGPVAEVDQGAGQGGVPAPVASIGVIQNPLQRLPVQELVYAAEYIQFYVFPRTSPGLKARRQGYFITMKVRDDQFADERAMREDRLQLRQLNNIHLDEQGQLVIDRERTLEAAPSDLDQLRLMGAQRPWRETGASQTVNRTTVVFPATGQAVSTIQPASAPAGALQTPLTVSSADIERSIQQATQALQHQAPGATGTPPLPRQPPGAIPPPER